MVMRLTKEISERLLALVGPVVTETGLELVEINLKRENEREILDIVIDSERGVTVDDCALISEKVSLLLDIEDLFQHKYYLEVGSPGIFRELKSEKDFLKNTGKRVKAKFRSPVNGYKQFIGLLQACRGTLIVLSDGTQEFEVALANLKKIQLYPEL
jgi:ribosome maturation factor RimP